MKTSNHHYFIINTEKTMNTSKDQVKSDRKPQDHKPTDNASLAPTELQVQMIELQMNMAHLELTVDRLDEVITQQDKHIRDLQRQLQLVYKQVENQTENDGIAPFDVMADRPPHY
jgi:SlyX protein